MKVFEVDNVNEAVAKAVPYLLSEGIRETSRNGDVIVAPGPVMTVYKNPWRRVLFSTERNANPFFHLMEALWMLAGRNDLAWPLYFNSRFSSFSDDGVSCWGAYGARWRGWFGYDQLTEIVKELKDNPDSRRCVLQMWDGVHDIRKARAGGKDVPCNTVAYFDLRGGKLNMTVSNRSNDVMWGAYGANAVHFSFLQEFLASWLGAQVGVYRQFSNNFHVYTEHFPVEKLEKIAVEGDTMNLYKDAPMNEERRLIMTSSVEDWMEDLQDFLSHPSAEHTYNDSFFSEVVRPMFLAWNARKERTGNGAREAVEIQAKDWQVACLSWIGRKEARLV